MLHLKIPSTSCKIIPKTILSSFLFLFKEQHLSLKIFLYPYLISFFLSPPPPPPPPHTHIHTQCTLHCVPDSKITKLPLLEDLSNPKFMSSLSFPSSFALKSTHKFKKPTFKLESTTHSRHVEFDKWREQCVRRRFPRPSFTFSAIAAIIWKP